MATLVLLLFSNPVMKDSRVSILMLTIVGLTVFELIFEARARYLFGYAPVYIILAVMGLNNIVSKLHLATTR